MRHAPRKQRLSELTITKSKPKATAYLVWDTRQHGLALRVQPTGRKSWQVIYSRHGRPRWMTLGRADSGGIPLSDARTMAGEVMLAVAKGDDPAADRKAERASGTFAELHEKYLDQHAKKHNKSWQQANKLIQSYVLPRWAKLQANTITRGDVKALMASIAAPISANQTLAAVSAIFTWAVKEEILPANPCKLVERNPTTSRDRVLADSEIPTFWNALDDIDPVRAGALRFILLTGQRPGEVAHLRREHIIDGWWEMPGEPVPALGWPGTKNGESHRVWLPAAAQAVLADLDGDASSGFVFASARGGPITDLDRAMRELFQKLGGTPARPHDLRRTHGSTITKLGFGRDAMNRIQNHREGGITDVYDRHRYEDENKRVMETVAAKIVALVEAGPETNVVRFSAR
jgi:integrase